ncbi:MAG: multiprotein bridging factor aMBF1 [Nitrososphaerales archaeon]
MNCELCGGNIRGEPLAVNLDGGVFRVCSSCARLGKPARVPERRTAPRPVAPASFMGSVRARKPNPPPSPTFEDYEMELRTDYSKTIKEAREMRGLSQEDLGRKINEKPSMISHLETGSMKPDDILARKLEHFLKIDLFVPVEDETKVA